MDTTTSAPFQVFLLIFPPFLLFPLRQMLPEILHRPVVAKLLAVVIVVYILYIVVYILTIVVNSLFDLKQMYFNKLILT